MDKEDRYKYEGNFRIGAYEPIGCGNIKFMVVVDKDECSEEEQDFYADWMTLGLVAKLGHDHHKDDIPKSLEQIEFRLKSGGQMTERIYAKVMDMMHYAAAWMFGKKIVNPEVEFDDYQGDGQAVKLTHQGYYHIGKSSKIH